MYVDDKCMYVELPSPQTISSSNSGESMNLLSQLWTALGGRIEDARAVEISGAGDLPSVFAVTELAVVAIGAAGLSVAELLATKHAAYPTVRVDRRLASMWFASSLRPIGWTLPPIWDAIAGDYQAADGWIKLHTNAPAHRAAALNVLGVPAEKDAVTQAVFGWKKDALEAAIVDHGGCAAAMRSVADWHAHPQGGAIAVEPLFHLAATGGGSPPRWPVPQERPLSGIRVLDLTRVLAGPVATRFLAGLGADVLRVDPPGWEEPALVPEVTLGKRCTRLDLREDAGRSRFIDLLSQADVLVHGYRPEALARLGFDPNRRRELQPGLIDVTLDAYGWTGPWAARRGFDSLVQMSSGIAEAGMRAGGRNRPTPLPVQALDHATGYLLAAAVIRGLTARLITGAGLEARTSLARVAAVLIGHPAGSSPPPLDPETPADFSVKLKLLHGDRRGACVRPSRLQALRSAGTVPAVSLGSSPPNW